MIFSGNQYAYVDSGALYVHHLTNDQIELISVVGDKDLIAFEFNNADRLFIFDDCSMLGQCFQTEEVENPVPCATPQLSAIRVKRLFEVTPQYVNPNYDYWTEKPEICDFKVFENSLNFLTVKTDQYSAICHKYDGTEYPVSSTCVSAQYWFTMPLGTFDCSAIDYNIIPLRNHLGEDYEAGERCYEKFNYDGCEISLIYTVDEYRFDLINGPFVLPEYFCPQPLSSIRFSRGTASHYQDNADLFISYETSACAWLSANCVWIDTETQLPSNIFLSGGGVYEYHKISIDNYENRVNSISSEIVLCFDFFSGGYLESISDLSLSPLES